MTVQRKNVVVVGVRLDCQSRELLNWALLKVADSGDQVIAVHVCRDSDSTSKFKALLDDYLEVYEGLCSVKRVGLTGEVLKGSSIRKVLVREAKDRGAVAVIVGINREKHLGSWTSVARYCTKHLPPTTDILAIHNGKVVFRKSWSNQLPDLKGDPRPSFYIFRNPALFDSQPDFGNSETSEIFANCHEPIQCSEDESKVGNGDSVQNIGKKLSSSSFSFLSEDFPEQRPGWPLFGGAAAAAIPVNPPADEARKMSVVQWVMNLPNRPQSETPKLKRNSTRKSKSSMDKSDMSLSKYSELPEKLHKLLLKTNSSFGCKCFSYDILKNSTSQFSSDKLIGRGGCNFVYKGLLPDGKSVAVKVSRSCKDALKEFTQEIDIMTSLKHKNIAALIGICVEENDLISVYDFLSRGSLEDNLHGNDKEKSVLSWEVRFKLAVGTAEALNYLHNECAPPIIHRDVKSSNILLSDEFEPQLSDFGLAIWGSSSSLFLTDDDVVGTFGYLAPEYFMYGKLSDKVDVYSFGVVLLELLSGRKPISFETDKGQESLVMWAKPKLGTGDLRGILDPTLDGNLNEIQIQRMGLAARLCLTRSARLRPKMSLILEILKGEKDVDKWVESQFGDEMDGENQYNSSDDEVYPHLSMESHLGLALLDVEDNSTSFSSVGQSSRISLEEFFKGRWSRSSSFN